jgi:hypothetical protein
VTGRAQSLSEEEILLLRAALLEGDAALSAFAEWRKRIDWMSIGPDATKLLPLLHQNLTRLGVTDPLMARLHGVRRYTWVGNLKRMTLTRRGFEALHTAGIPTIVFKGVALIICYLHDRSLRAMDDIDLLVPYDRLRDAASALENVGIRPMYANADHLVEQIQRRSMLPGWPFVGAATEDIDVHWHALHCNRQRHADDDFWAASNEALFEGIPVRVLNPADQLLQVCTHAAQPDSNTSLRWVADATQIVRGAGSGLSWDRLVQQAARHRVSFLMAESLRYLNRVVDLTVPEDAVEKMLRNSTIGEKVEVRLTAPNGRSQLGWAASRFLEFQNFRRGPNGFDTTSAFRALPQFLKNKYEVASLPKAIAAAIYEKANRPRRLRRSLGLGHRKSVADWTRLPVLTERLTFSDYTSHEWAFLSGWSEPEKTGRWTVGKEARLGWRIADRSSDLVCRVEAMPGLHDVAHPVMAVEIWANNVQVDRWRFNAATSIVTVRSIQIARSVFARDEVLVLSFIVLDPFVPARAGISPDTRELGLHLRSLTFQSEHNLDRVEPA